ncbi:hypothetical protein HDV01_006676 [Terramyces sp. JEL0728]|nr:hypothetical protein HDV01_006676 [Terramyces sp. JEL0728]
MEPTFFTIDASPLVKRSRKPKHVEKRLKSRPISDVSDGLARHEAFLAARREKLSNRTAHVKKVVDVHKSKVSKYREAKLSMIEQTIETANQKRQNRLDKSVAFHGKQVKRAQEIARTQLQRSIEDKAVLKNAIDTRLRISEFRRKKLQSIPRSRLLGSQSWELQEALSLQDESAQVIQHWWRRVKFVPLAKVYRKVGLTKKKAAKMAFDALVSRIQSAILIKATNFLLLRAKKMSTKKPKKWNNPARVLLSAYLITCYPSETLQNMDAQEEDIAVLAEQLLSDMEHWLAAANSNVIGALGSIFLESFIAFYEAFEAWKSRDTMKIVDDIIRHFMELDRLWVSVHHQVDALNEWAPAIKEQQQTHLNRIKKFGDAAIQRLASARMEFRESLVGQEPKLIEPEEMKLFVSAVEFYVFETSGPQDTLISEPEEEIQKDLGSFGDLLSNEQLAHELILDPEFSLKPKEKTPFEARVEEIAKKAYADAIQEELNQKVYRKNVLNVVMEIRQALIGMVDEKGAVAHEVGEVLDKEYLMHQIENKVFDLAAIIKYVGEKMLQLCAPVRDAEIRALNNESQLSTILIKMVDILEKMKLDLANFRLQSIKPHLRQQAVEYEKTKFDQALGQKTASLEKTKLWLLKSVQVLSQINDERNPESIENDSKLRFEQVFNHALLSLLFATTPVEQSTLAETLIMDGKRLFDYQNEIQAITIVSAIVMLSKNIVTDLRLENKLVREMSTRLFNLLKQEDTNVEKLANEIIETCNIMYHKQTKLVSNLSNMTTAAKDQKLKELTLEQCEMLNSMVQKTLSYKDPLFNVLNRRIEKVIRVTMETKFRRDSLGKNGLDTVDGELEMLANKLAIFAKHNKAVYGVHYDSILNQLV